MASEVENLAVEFFLSIEKKGQLKEKMGYLCRVPRKVVEAEIGVGNCNDYGARWYDAAIGRFTTVDPLASNYSFQSPYAYATNNPVLLRDIMGMGVQTDYYNQKGKKVKHVDDGKEDQVVVFTNSSSSRTVNKAIKNGKTAKLPSTKVRRAMGDAVERSNSPTGDDKKGGLHEESLAWGQVAGNEVILDGPSGEYASPDLDMIDTDFPDFSGFDQLEGTAHVHPKNGPWDGEPSGEDMLIQLLVEKPEKGNNMGYPVKKPISGPSFILAPKDGKAYIYTSEGTLGHIPLDFLVNPQ